MAQPAYRAPEIRDLQDTILADASGEKHPSITDRIQSDVCNPPPLGCGGPAVEFSDAVSRREYSISGMCQECQDGFFEGDLE